MSDQQQGGSSKRVEFFCANDYASIFRTQWYWRDDACEEPMGPFDSRDQAVADYRLLRQLSASGEGATK